MSQDSTEVRCVALGCNRTCSPDRSFTRICARCTGYVAADLWLAIHDHMDQMRVAGSTTFHPFLAWCFQLLIQVAAHEAGRYRYARRAGREADIPPFRRWCIEGGYLGV